MTVCVAHAPADRAAAEGLEKVVERRGQFVELDDGVTALRPIQHGDVLILLVSQALMFATARLRIEQRALDAWADGRLIVVKLDHGIAPVGLRDLPAIDASFEAQREFTWMKVADAIREKLRPSQPPAAAAPRAAKGRGWPLWLVLLLIAAAAVIAPLLSARTNSAIESHVVLFGIAYTWAQIGVAIGAVLALAVVVALLAMVLGRASRRKEAPGAP